MPPHLAFLRGPPLGLSIYSGELRLPEQFVHDGHRASTSALLPQIRACLLLVGFGDAWNRHDVSGGPCASARHSSRRRCTLVFGGIPLRSCRPVVSTIPGLPLPLPVDYAGSVCLFSLNQLLTCSTREGEGRRRCSLGVGSARRGFLLACPKAPHATGRRR
jgi:hypothetical protein